MAKRKVTDSKQLRLTSNLKLKSPKSSPAKEKSKDISSRRKLKRSASKSPTKSASPQKAKKNSPKDSPKTNTKGSPKGNTKGSPKDNTKGSPKDNTKGRPKPQVTASPKLINRLLAVGPNGINLEVDEVNKADNFNNNNNNNNEKEYPILNNNNNNNNEKECTAVPVPISKEKDSNSSSKVPISKEKYSNSSSKEKDSNSPSKVPLNKEKDSNSSSKVRSSKEKDSNSPSKVPLNKEKDSNSSCKVPISKEKDSNSSSKQEKPLAPVPSSKEKELVPSGKENRSVPSPPRKQKELIPSGKENESTPVLQTEKDASSEYRNVPVENLSPPIFSPERLMSSKENDFRAITPMLGSALPTTPKAVRCKVCKQWYPNRYFQRKHMLMEHEDQLYECRVCSFNSVDPEKLKSHIIKLHVAKKEKADSFALDLQGELEKLIDKKVPRKVMMEDGVTLGRDVNSKMRYVCALCSRIYTSKYSLERHVRCHTLEKPYHCDVCSFTSSYREHMMRHMTSVHLIVHSNVPKVKYVPKKRKPGEEENASDTSSPGERSVEGQKKRRNILRERFECAVCGMKATHKTDLVDHIKNKHPNAHIESLENNDGSKVHLIVTMAKKPKPTKKLTIQCSFCSLIFHDTWKYKVHMRSHTGVKPFQCSLCDVRATSKMTVRDHIHRKHRNEINDAKILLRTVGIDGSVEEVEMPVPWKEFRCDVCSLLFEDNYNLKAHKQKEHLSAYPFFCIVCSRKELTKAAMIIHCATEHKNENLDNIIMKNEKPCKIGALTLPKCDICDRLFSYRSQLNIHTKTHTGEKAFNCDHCDYKTNLKHCLDNHVQRIHFGRKRTVDLVKRKLKDIVTSKPAKPRGRPKGSPNIPKTKLIKVDKKVTKGDKKLIKVEKKLTKKVPS